MGLSRNLTIDYSNFSIDELDREIPELRLKRIRERKNSGIAFGGGGMRAFIATIAAFDALSKIQTTIGTLIETPRYASAVSGAAWGSAVSFFGSREKNYQRRSYFYDQSPNQLFSKSNAQIEVEPPGRRGAQLIDHQGQLVDLVSTKGNFSLTLHDFSNVPGFGSQGFLHVLHALTHRKQDWKESFRERAGI
jgi:hypothetical protein